MEYNPFSMLTEQVRLVWTVTTQVSFTLLIKSELGQDSSKMSLGYSVILLIEKAVVAKDKETLA